MPSSIEQLAMIDGIGESKISEYGEEIIEIVKLYDVSHEINDRIFEENSINFALGEEENI